MNTLPKYEYAYDLLSGIIILDKDNHIIYAGSDIINALAEPGIDIENITELKDENGKSLL
jgi:hypothetical protein